MASRFTFPLFPLIQSEHTQFAVHNSPAPKHSQYFLWQRERLQRQPRTVRKEPPGLCTSWSSSSSAVPLKAPGLFKRICLIALMRCSSCSPSLRQSVHTQSGPHRVSFRKHWQYCFRHFVLPHRQPRSLPLPASLRSFSSCRSLEVDKPQVSTKDSSGGTFRFPGPNCELSVQFSCTGGSAKTFL
jgi:hypothetical protein